MTLEQKQKVEAFVEKADMGPNEHNTSVNISFDTKEFIDVTPTNGLREYCYELLYERSVEEANQSGISKNNLMSIAHIRWETEVHLAFYGWLENSNKTELNVEENWYRLAKRFFRAVFGG